MNNSSLLHVYGQHSEHDEVWIVGNREALTKLRDIINITLTTKFNCRSDILMTSDGEGYKVHVICNNTPWQGEYWKNLRQPYTGSASEDHREGAKWPWEGNN